MFLSLGILASLVFFLCFFISSLAFKIARMNARLIMLENEKIFYRSTVETYELLGKLREPKDHESTKQ